MRYGFTTGSCATAASKAATYMLLTGKLKQNITIQTPKGILFHAEILEITRSEKKILIRDCSNYRGLCTGYYRIAVKTHEENEKLITQLKDTIMDKCETLQSVN